MHIPIMFLYIQPKRRRSSAGPSLGGPSRRKSVKPTQPTLLEESEPEEESEPAVRKVGRKKHVCTVTLNSIRSSR